MADIQNRSFPYDDGEFADIVLMAARDYTSRMAKSSRPIDVNECIRVVLEEFKTRYRTARGYKRNAPLKPEHTREMSDIYRRIGPFLEEKARDIAMKRSVLEKARDINRITAQAAVSAETEKTGLDCELVCQCHRAKVLFRLPGGYKVRMVIPYRDIVAGRLPEIMDAFRDFAGRLKTVPCEVTIGKKIKL